MAGLLVAKTIVHVLGFEFIALTGLVTAIIGGVTFTLSILFAGAIPDYKESGKILGESTWESPIPINQTKFPSHEDKGRGPTQSML